MPSSPSSSNASAPSVQIPANRGAIMAMLIFAYILNFVDRQIVGILAVPIKADLGLSDGELGLMGGLAFALFYTSLGIPVAMLADRFNRSWIISAALLIWSLMTAACGLAQNFWQLFLARLGVGVGEAGGVAPAYSLIADYFPPTERARALSLYSFGIPIGSAFGIIAGGLIATYLDWRMAFFIVGTIGVLVVPVFKMVVKEPKRGQFDPQPESCTGAENTLDTETLEAGGSSPAPGIKEVLRTIAAKPSFWGLSLGAACSSMMGYGLFFWLPSFLVRSFGLTLLEASWAYGAMLLVGGIIGIWIGGVIADKYGAKNKALYALIPACAFLLTCPFYIVGIFSTNIVVCLLIMLIPTALGLAWLGPILAAIQQLVPPTMRATASAVFLFVNNLVGIGAGTWALGVLSDSLVSQFGQDSLRYSILAGSVFYIAAAAFFYWSSKRLDKDWHR